MKKWVGVGFLGLMMAASAAADLAWQNMQMSEVKVSFPATPRYKMSSEATPVGPVMSQNYTYNGKDMALVANSSKLPSIVLTFRSAEALYEEAAKALLREHPGAQRLSMQPLQVLGHSAAELRFRVPSGEEGRARFVLVNDVLYTTQATWKGPTPQAVERFLGSMTMK